ncbi:hypothetical protein [Changpingibacter yushuensis]|uniref:hypothetical protein n=1 Tax=Changpingibacter yushuensis TaxID=2758440 RepID=UPI00165E67CD|nr:hypothetical protein [Changpingibacter yushuensis]
MPDLDTGAAALAKTIVGSGSLNTTRTALATVSIGVDAAGVKQAPVVTMRGSGVALGCTWLAGTVVEDGDTVLVQILGADQSPKTGLVLGKVTSSAAPATGVVTAVPSGSATITVTAEWLGSIDCVFVGSAPAVGDTVMLLWQGGQAVCVGKRTTTESTSGTSQSTGSTAGGRGSASSGVTQVRATDSATWTAGYNWNSYFGRAVYQGTWGSTGPSYGCFFYGRGAAGLSSRTVTGLRVWLGPRKRAGYYTSAVQVVFSLHGLRSKSGTPSLTGAQSVSVPAGFLGGWCSLPASWGDDLAGGAGIAISGPGYAGFAGVGESPQSGLLEFTWKG